MGLKRASNLKSLVEREAHNVSNANLINPVLEGGDNGEVLGRTLLKNDLCGVDSGRSAPHTLNCIVVGLNSFG